LRCDLQSRAGFRGVLGGQVGTSANRVLVRQTDFQRVTNLSAGLGERIVIFLCSASDATHLPALRQLTVSR
jgi:hypothetical protein